MPAPADPLRGVAGRVARPLRCGEVELQPFAQPPLGIERRLRLGALKLGRLARVALLCQRLLELAALSPPLLLGAVGPVDRFSLARVSLLGAHFGSHTLSLGALDVILSVVHLLLGGALLAVALTGLRKRRRALALGLGGARQRLIALLLGQLDARDRLLHLLGRVDDRGLRDGPRGDSRLARRTRAPGLALSRLRAAARVIAFPFSPFSPRDRVFGLPPCLRGRRLRRRLRRQGHAAFHAYVLGGALRCLGASISVALALLSFHGPLLGDPRGVRGRLRSRVGLGSFTARNGFQLRRVRDLRDRLRTHSSKLSLELLAVDQHADQLARALEIRRQSTGERPQTRRREAHRRAGLATLRHRRHRPFTTRKFTDICHRRHCRGLVG
jgi:hypothetical protein